MVDDELAAANTDRELWREREGDYYANSVHVTAQGSLGIKVGGHVIVKPLADWHALANATTHPNITEVVERLGVLLKMVARNDYRTVTVTTADLRTLLNAARSERPAVTAEMIAAGVAAMDEAEDTPMLNPPNAYLAEVAIRAAFDVAQGERPAVEVDLDKSFFAQLGEAAAASNWIPQEHYFVNDWVADCCEFLRTGQGVERPDVRELIEKRIVKRRQTMNDPANEPALRYMASGAFEELRDLRTAIGKLDREGDGARTTAPTDMVCASCGKPMGRDCAQCQKDWAA